MLDRATPPEERRAILARMKETLVQARLGVDDLRAGVEKARAQLERERAELETVRRRKGLAAQINDAETVAVAERFETLHAERTEVLEQKLATQEREVAIGERELEEMTRELKQAMHAPNSMPRAAAPDPLDDGSANVQQEIAGLARERARADREADADRRLEELKRKMTKGPE